MSMRVTFGVDPGLSGSVAVLLDGEPVLHFLPLLATHAKARGESATAEYDELDGGEHQGGHHARLLKAFVMEDDVVDHFEGNDR